MPHWWLRVAAGYINVSELLLNPEYVNVGAASQSHVCSDVCAMRGEIREQAQRRVTDSL